ncbi:MAG: NAD(P)H-dependent oxidoreductase [Burkholderiaceae bacterium]|nr:NAD(P)H-dependent oxidoreductase [Burkholderiaceae bacterium]
MPRLLIVWWSMTGGTRQLAEALAEGAREEPGIDPVSLCADQAGAADVLAAQAFVFATPENLASMAGMMKDFFDRTYYPVLGRVDGLPYATLVCAGTDGTGAARQIARIATGWRLKEIAPPLVVVVGAQTPQEILAPKRIQPAQLEHARELGRTLGAGLSMGIW